jgi:DNA polymerase I-like protein with 3'-5' exonuclease and polymerase domains
MKKALVILDSKFKELYPNEDISIVANVHDEWQIESPEHVADAVGQLGVQSIKDAGIYFKLNCPMDGEYHVGTNWSETH